MNILETLSRLLAKLENTPVLLEQNHSQAIRAMLAEIQTLQDFDLRILGDSLYDGIYITDGNGITLYANKAYEKISGIPSSDIVGKNIAQLEGVYFKNAVSLEVIKQKKIVNSIGQSLINHNKMLITGSPIFDEKGNVKRVLVNNRDFSELLEMKEELEQSIEQLKAVAERERKNKNELEYLRGQTVLGNLVGKSPAMAELKAQIQMVAKVDVNVLITGETGVGKEMAADEIYERSNLKGQPYIKVNCGAIPKELFESELFGYEKGSFTGANLKGKNGLFELANHGTILLDEIGELPLEAQSKLLRVLQSKELLRVGGTKPIKIECRILAATNRNLKKMVDNGQFREDLYYRLNVFPVNIPPLRERMTDLDDLIDHFCYQFSKKYQKNIRMTDAVRNVFKGYSWPGNIREMENILERLFIVSQDEDWIVPSHVKNMLHVQDEAPEPEKSLTELLQDYERKLIAKAIQKHKTTRKAAEALGISQSAVVKKMQRLNLS